MTSPALPGAPPFIAVKQVAVTPSDTTVYNFSALYIGTAGDITITPYQGDPTVTYHNVAVGWMPVSGSKVNAATTAGQIVAVN